MKKLKNLLGSSAAAIYFLFPMSFILLVLLIMPIGFLIDVSAVRNSGFAGPNSAADFIFICGFSIGLSILIPPLRKMYRVLPWLYQFTKIFFTNLVILNIGITILNMGYQVKNNTRHTVFFIFMIAQIVICRIVMCIYFKLKPVRHIEER